MIVRKRKTARKKMGDVLVSTPISNEKRGDPFFRDLMNYANEPSRIWNEHIQYCKKNNIKIDGWGLLV